MSTITVPKTNAAPASPDFERIFREHASLVYRTAYAVMGNREDADDILQTIFLRLLRRECPPDLAKNPQAYLYRAALNLSLDTLKIRRRQPQRTDDPEHIETPSRDSEAPFDDDMHRLLYEAIAQLSPEAAEILILRRIVGISEISPRIAGGRGPGILLLMSDNAGLTLCFRGSLHFSG